MVSTWIGEAYKGFVVSIIAINLTAISLREALTVFQNMGLLPFVAIISGLILLLSVADYIGDFDILITISEWIDNLFKD